MRQMKILITGASGFIGRHLTKKLLENKSDEIYVLARDKNKAMGLKELGAQVIMADITKPETLKDLPVVDEVYHLAGKLGQVGVPDQVYEKLHIAGTKNLVQALNKKALKKFLFFSSPSVCGPNVEKTPWTETDPYAPSNIYEKTKAEAEKFLLTQDLPLTIIRPEFVYGPGDKHVIKLIQSIAKGWFPIMGKGDNLLQPTYIDDVIEAVEIIRKSDKATHQTYLVVGKEKISVMDYAKTVCEVYGKKFRAFKVPKPLAYILALGFEIMGQLFRFTPPLSFQRIKFFTTSHTFSSEKMKRDFGWEAKVDLKTGLTKTINRI